MPRHMPRYVEVRIKGEPFTFNIRTIRYRDSKGHFSRFTTKKKLSVEVIGERSVVDKKTHKTVLAPKVIKKYSQPLRKRKRRVTIQEVEKRIHARLMREKKTVIETMVDGKVLFTYPGHEKIKKSTKKTTKRKKVTSEQQKRYIKKIRERIRRAFKI